MADKVILGNAQSVDTMLRTDSIMVEIGGSIRRMSLDNFMNAINEGNEELLRTSAWCVPIKQSTQISSSWGRGGNLQLYEEYKRHGGRYLYLNDGRHAKLSRTNSSVFADGTPLDESIGHIMVKMPSLYYFLKEDEVSGITNLWMSPIPIGGHVINQPVVAAYKASMSGSALTSRSGVAPKGSININAYWNAAQVNGKDWGLADYEHQKFFIMLQLSEFGNANIQSVLGNGLTGTNNSSDYATALGFPCGNTRSLGDSSGAIEHNYEMSSGTMTQNACDVSLCGFENLYGQQWEMRQGIYCGKSNNDGQDGTEIFIYSGNRMPTTAELASHPAGDYRQLQRLSSGGYVREIILGQHFDIMPKIIGGGSTTSWGDYSYVDIANGQLVLFGGAAGDGASCGLVYSHSSCAWSIADATLGSRLAFYGKGKEVTGREIVA